MSGGLAFLGILLMSLVVAMLAALQLADFFRATEEFILVIAVIAVFSGIATAAFAIASVAARRAGTFNLVAFGLLVLAFVMVSVPALSEWIAARSSNPFSIGPALELQIVLEILVPSLLVVLVQWGLARRRWRRAAGEEDLTRWPWITTVVAGLAILNPFGLAILASALKRDPGDWMWQFWTMVTSAAIAAVVVIGGIECYIRARILRRRVRAVLPHL
jgi:hypothetical protein